VAAALTDDQLTEMRLKRAEDTLEQHSGVGRQLERDVDRLKIELPRMESALQEHRAESALRHNELHKSLSRLHERLDELAADDHRDQGARNERARLGKWMIAAVGAGSAAAGAIVGLLSLVIQH
jgi:DNA repair exonuclease SbcCD ATPase subunit